MNNKSLLKTKPKLLVIPHLYTNKLKIRSYEFARHLSNEFDVYFWHLEDISLIYTKNYITRRIHQLKIIISSFFKKHYSYKKDDLIIIEDSYIPPSFLSKLFGIRIGMFLTRTYNTFVLSKILSNLNPDAVFIASINFYIPKTKSKFFYDFIDWLPEDNATYMADLRSYIEHLKKNVEVMYAPCDTLAKKLSSEYNMSVVTLHNGCDIDIYRQKNLEELQELRKHWDLENKYVIGYIGNHTESANIDFIIKVISQLKETNPDICLLIVGPTDYWSSFLNKHRSKNIITTGFIDPTQIPNYYNLIDLGIIAFERSAGTDYIFPLKLVEYTACRKLIISMPLTQLVELKWPNILIADKSIGEWIKVIIYARTIKWEASWDKLVEPFDWAMLTQKLAQDFNQHLNKK